MNFSKDEFKINESLKNKPFLLLFFIFTKVFKNLFQMRLFQICLFLMILVQINNFFDGISWKFLSVLNFNIFYVSILIPVLVCLEEFFHATICLAKGKAENLQSLYMGYMVNKKQRKVITTKIIIRFKGQFSKLDILHIHTAGPLCVMLLVTAFMIALFIIGDKNLLNFWITYLYILLIPASSLIPVNLLVESDGKKLIKISKELGLSFFSILKEVSYSVYLVFRYLFISRKLNLTEQLVLHRDKAYNYYEKNNINAAINELQKIIEIDKKDAEAYNNLACCYIQLNKELDKALKYSQKAIELSPNELAFRDTYNSLNAKIGNYAELDIEELLL